MEFEIFAAGTHTASNGNTHSFTQNDLDNIVASYNPELHEAPIVIGHPKDNAPAFGWIESIKRVGDKLIAKPKQLVPEFLQAVKNGLFKKRSISLNPDGSLRHVGFLGAVPPAVKGLADIKFSAGEEILSFEFSELTGEDDNELSSDNDNEIISFADEIKKQSEFIKELFAGLAMSIKADREKMDALIEDSKNYSDSLKSLFDKNEDKNFTASLDGFVANGTLTPAMKNNLSNFADSVAALDFSAADYKNTIRGLIIQLVSSFPKFIDNSEFANPPAVSFSNNSGFEGFLLDKSSADIHKKALEISNAENIDYSAALNKVLNFSH